MTWQLVDLQHPVSHLILTAALVFAFAGTGMATAQQTVYVGGSGKPPVEVHMEVLDQLAPPLRMRVVLDPPGQAPRSAFLLGAPPATGATTFFKPLVVPATPEPKPALATSTAAAPTVTAIVAPTVSQPLPDPVPAPDPAPLTPVTTEPLPLPVVEPVAAPQPTSTATVALAPPEETVAAAPPEPEPVPEPAVTAVPEPTVAALTPEPARAAGEILSIPFAGGSSELPGGAEGDLRAIADQLTASDTLRAQVKAYADGSTGSASSARRLSLSRALAVRSILIELGVRSTRIDVRALGDRNEGGAPDRVDVLVINR